MNVNVGVTSGDAAHAVLLASRPVSPLFGQMLRDTNKASANKKPLEEVTLAKLNA